MNIEIEWKMKNFRPIDVRKAPKRSREDEKKKREPSCSVEYCAHTVITLSRCIPEYCSRYQSFYQIPTPKQPL